MTVILPSSLGRAAATHDLMAAELVSIAAADGNEGAQELVDEINDALGVAYVHRERAKRLKSASARASLAGEHDVAALVGRFAGEEAEAAREHEAVASGIVRSTHAFGFLSAEEQKFLARKKFEEGMSTAQAEQVYSQLLDRLFQVSANFGVDESGAAMGAEEPSAHEPDELDDGSIEAFGEVVEALGGDLPLVFGAGCYDAFGAVFAGAATRLRRRQKRLRARLEKLTERVEGLEDEGKSGLRVKALHWRIEKIEKRLAKIGRKLRSLKKTKGKVDASEEEAELIEKAEDSAVRSTVEPDIDDLPEDPDALDALSDEDLLAELEEGLSDIEDDSFDLDDLEESDDDALGAEVEVFGLSERRKRRMMKRISRLERRLERVQERREGFVNRARVKRLLKRIQRLKLRLARKTGVSMDEVDDAMVDGPSALPSFGPPSGGYATALTTPTVQAYSSGRGYVDSFFGSANMGPDAERQPFVCYFRRRAESRGSMNMAFGAEQSEGFFARLGSFFQRVLVEPLQNFFSPEKRERRRQNREDRRQRVQAWLAERRQNIDARRSAARAERKAARQDLAITDKRKKLRKVRKDRVEVTRDMWKAASPRVRRSRKDLSRGRRDVRRRVMSARRGTSPDGSGSPRRRVADGGIVFKRHVQPDGLYQDQSDPRYIYRKAGGRLFVHKSPRSKRIDRPVDASSAGGKAIASAIDSGAAVRIA